MSQEKISNRWFVVVGAVLIQLCLGAIYAWSVFTPALIKAGWTKLDTQIIFAVGLATFALVMAFAGKKLPIWRPHRLARMGGLTLGLGYFIAGALGGTGFWPVLIGVGVIGCAGIG
ncbi:MAG TPA: MFS transporter, partial [Magnetococcales bacterium]|nr:MFS transporter [Magnetococcales bacterium]